MPRPLRHIAPNVCYHVMNRGNGRRRIFHKPRDYEAFVRILAEAVECFDVQLMCWCVMPNHWHLVLMPASAKAMIDFMRFLTVTHVRRHHGHYQSAAGHLYEGRYKSFPVHDAHHFLLLCRYVENNARRAKLVKAAERWEWSSLHQWIGGVSKPVLSDWPVHRPRGWAALVNRPMADEEVAEVRASIERDRPLGPQGWVRTIAARLGLQQTLNARGRPRRPLKQLLPRQLRRRTKEDQNAQQRGHNGK